MEEEILEQQEQEIIEEPIVYMKQQNPEGLYIDKDGVRWDILTCHHTESKEWYDTGDVDEEGNPIYAERIVINKGWDSFDSLEDAMKDYGVEVYPETITNKNEGILENTEEEK